MNLPKKLCTNCEFTKHLNAMYAFIDYTSEFIDTNMLMLVLIFCGSLPCTKYTSGDNINCLVPSPTFLHCLRGEYKLTNT